MKQQSKACKPRPSNYAGDSPRKKVARMLMWRGLSLCAQPPTPERPAFILCGEGRDVPVLDAMGVARDSVVLVDVDAAAVDLEPVGEVPVKRSAETVRGRSREPSRPSRRILGRRLNVAGLFAGIGGFELGLGRSGHQARLLCEIDPAARAVLQARFPRVHLHDDVCTLENLPGIDLLVGGFPCQDLSQAGRTAGIGGARSGLVGEVLRLLESQRVPALLLENVSFMRQLQKGQALEQIVSTLERLGYHWAYRVCDSRSFGLPQRRQRVYLLAVRGDGLATRRAAGADEPLADEPLADDPRRVLFADEAGPLTSSQLGVGQVACGFYWTEGVRGLGWAVDAVPTLKGGSTVGVPSPPAVVLPDGRVVTPSLQDAERLQGFRADWTKPAEAVARQGARWKLVGNAVSVPAVRWLGKRLLEPGVPLVTEERGGRPLPAGSPWPLAAWNVGRGRFAAELSEFPLRRKTPALEGFLRDPKPLSQRATAGFLSRTERSKLRFPPGFLAALRDHLAALS